MDWREKIRAAWPNDLQKSVKCQMALREIEGAIGTLTALGFPLHVEEGPETYVPPAFPKKVFHLRAGERLVACQAELDELGPDWHPTMDEARHAAGVAKQMQRGGIFDRSLPSVVMPGVSPAQKFEEKAEVHRQAEAIREEFRLRIVSRTQ